MPYIKETVIAGNIISVRKYYSARYKKSGIVRGANINSTSSAVRKINLENTKRKLWYLLDMNFKKGDYHLTLTYKPSMRPKTVEDAKADIKKFIRKLRSLCEIKYVYVPEQGKRGAIHFHMVINKIDTEEITKAWEQFGRVRLAPLYGSSFRGLAEYLLKQYEGEEGFSGYKYHRSKNLKSPVIKKEIVKSDSWRGEIRPIFGYYLEKESVWEGISSFGFPMQCYTLIRLNE